MDRMNNPAGRYLARANDSSVAAVALQTVGVCCAIMRSSLDLSDFFLEFILQIIVELSLKEHFRGLRYSWARKALSVTWRS